MSGLETLPPDQRAVLQLILVQGRGYADLARLLKLEQRAVRERAHAGLAALEPSTALDEAQRARIADYLLGQQDDSERLVTFAELGDSPAGAHWAQALRARLAPLAREELPVVPHAANGSTPATPPPPEQPPATPPPEQPPAEPAAATPAPKPSRLGGAILLGGIAVLAVVLIVVLLTRGGGGDDGNAAVTSTTPPATQQAQRQRTSTTPSASIVAQVNLEPTPAGGKAIGVGVVQRASGKLTVAVRAQHLAANGAQDVYAMWLQGSAGSHFLGFIPQQVKANGTFTVSSPLPANARSYATLLVTRESTAAQPKTPGTAILSGPLKLRG